MKAVAVQKSIWEKYAKSNSVGNISEYKSLIFGLARTILFQKFLWKRNVLYLCFKNNNFVIYIFVKL